jgi:hypothetical protein
MLRMGKKLISEFIFSYRNFREDCLLLRLIEFRKEFRKSNNLVVEELLLG